MINYEMALSEIEMYKKAHESLSENLTHANKKFQQFKEERNSLIDDLSWYKAKVSRLEREKEIFHRKLMAQLEVNTELRMSNKDKHNLLSEFSQHIGNKPSSSTYKYFRAKLDDLNITEDK